MSFNATGCNTCHGGAHGDFQDINPENNTISGFCGTCHGYFHLIEGIGGDTSSPFVRHPTDIVLPISGEYGSYNPNSGTNEYSVEAPVARTTVPSSISNTVTPGTDVIMCLSCHKAHASDYPDILRWDC